MVLRYKIYVQTIFIPQAIMKRIFTLLLIFCCITNGFSQTSSRELLSKKKTLFRDGYIYKNQHFADIDSSDNDDGKLLDMKDLTVRERVIKKILTNNFRRQNDLGFKIDSIPETAAVNINGVVFNNKNVLSKLSDYTIFALKKDSIYTYEYHTEKDSGVYLNVRVKYQRPKAMVYQPHPNLPHDFFVFKLNSLEPIRYKSSSYSPILDVFNTSDSIEINPKPRVMIDGRLQAKSFDYQRIDLKNFEKMEVFGGTVAKNYFGQKAKAGLISVITKGSTFKLDLALSTTRVIGEMQDKKGEWKVIVDTLFSTIDDFKKFHKKCLESNGAIYKINGNFETEYANRKTVDMDDISNIKMVSARQVKIIPLTISKERVETKTEIIGMGSDTVYIETKRIRGSASANSNFGKIISELQRLRNTTPDPAPIYIVDNQEIDSEKLKLYKPRELEFVESLEGCDAISKYGKRAEYGVVIYRKKKTE
jgi:hypothetical protein